MKFICQTNKSKQKWDIKTKREEGRNHTDCQKKLNGLLYFRFLNLKLMQIATIMRIMMAETMDTTTITTVVVVLSLFPVKVRDKRIKCHLITCKLIEEEEQNISK